MLQAPKLGPAASPQRATLLGGPLEVTVEITNVGDRDGGAEHSGCARVTPTTIEPASVRRRRGSAMSSATAASVSAAGSARLSRYAEVPGGVPSGALPAQSSPSVSRNASATRV
jgi:hypothetical protein